MRQLLFQSFQLLKSGHPLLFQPGLAGFQFSLHGQLFAQFILAPRFVNRRIGQTGFDTGQLLMQLTQSFFQLLRFPPAGRRRRFPCL